jgi:stage V sporulation protein B
MFPAAILFALAELLIPELARCNAAGSRLRIRYLVRRSLKVALLYGCLCAGGLYLIAEWLCTTLYDSPLASTYLRRYSLMIPMLYCDAITDAMTKGLGQQKACVRYNIITSSMDVVLLFVLLPYLGMDGYYISFLLTHLINFLLSLRRLLKITELRIPFYSPALCCSAAILAVFGGSFIGNPTGRIVAFLGLLGSLLTLFGVVGKADLYWLCGLLKKK